MLQKQLEAVGIERAGPNRKKLARPKAQLTLVEPLSCPLYHEVAIINWPLCEVKYMSTGLGPAHYRQHYPIR